jgi:hypothetical protein
MVSKRKSKISAALRDKLDSTPADEPIEVVVHLEPPKIAAGGSRAERIATTKQTFDRHVEQLASGVTGVGGKVLDTAWINSTARCLATPEQIERLQSDSSVKGLDAVGSVDFD